MHNGSASCCRGEAAAAGVSKATKEAEPAEAAAAGWPLSQARAVPAGGS